MLDEVDGFLQDDGLAHLVAGLVGLLALRHQLLQGVVAFLDGVSPLLLRGCVSLPSTTFLQLSVSTESLRQTFSPYSSGSSYCRCRHRPSRCQPGPRDWWRV